MVGGSGWGPGPENCAPAVGRSTKLAQLPSNPHKNQIGSVGKDDEGMSKDATDGQALEVVCVDFINSNSGDGVLEQVHESEG